MRRIFLAALTPAALNRGDDFVAGNRRLGSIGHSRIHRLMPMPYRLCAVSGQNRVHSIQSARPGNIVGRLIVSRFERR
jgi:hypothetical protein